MSEQVGAWTTDDVVKERFKLAGLWEGNTRPLGRTRVPGQRKGQLSSVEN